MSNINAVQDKIVDVLSTYSTLATIKKWHKVNGILLAVHPAGCVGVAKESFEAYSMADDKVIATIKIYLYLQHVKPDEGERQVRDLAHEARYALSTDRTLGGLIASGMITDMEYVSVDASETQLLHTVEITYLAEYYQPKLKGA